MEPRKKMFIDSFEVLKKDHKLSVIHTGQILESVNVVTRSMYIFVSIVRIFSCDVKKRENSSPDRRSIFRNLARVEREMIPPRTAKSKGRQNKYFKRKN